MYEQVMQAIVRLNQIITDMQKQIALLQTQEESTFSHVELTDGVTAPSTGSGIAKIYIDVADGDLKVKFSDGTVKTIVTDT